MKEIISNNKKIILLAGIALFFGILFVSSLIRLGVFQEDKKIQPVLNNIIIFDQPKLSIFDETKYINQFPDTVHMHYPNFIVVVPENSKQITTVYSLTQKKTTATFNDIVLDYYHGSFLYNYHGGNTYFGNKNLGIHYLLGFIKSSTEILCVRQNPANPLTDILLRVNPQTNTENILYSPQDAITAVYDDNNTLYVGEYDYNTKQAYVTINDKKIPVEDFVNIIYPINNSFYFASYKSFKNNQTESYSRIYMVNKNIKIERIRTNTIRFY